MYGRWSAVSRYPVAVARQVPALLLWIVCGACAATRSGGGASVPVASHPQERCVHGVPCETCVKCHPELAARFKAAGDWCPEHGVPESQCGICHPEVVVAPPVAPDGADVRHVAVSGEDVPSLDTHAVPGKVTIFDFYADWCGPCREIDAHVFQLLKARPDLAYRKLNIVSWESPLARRYLVAARVPSLPYVVVYGRDKKWLASISGLDLSRLDQAIRDGGGR
jgi:thiol-disulfide isomerase/thioredoxin